MERFVDYISLMKLSVEMQDRAGWNHITVIGLAWFPREDRTNLLKLANVGKRPDGYEPVLVLVWHMKFILQRVLLGRAGIVMISCP